MRHPFPVRLALTGTLSLLAVPAVAQDVNTDLMARWSAVEVVRYVVVGEYAGESPILLGASGFRSTGRVTDRIEITFDWNQNETAMVGTPVVRNGSSTVSPSPAAGCPAPRVDGTYEHLDVHSVTPLANTLKLAGTRRFPAGAVPFRDDEGVCSAWDNAQAKSEDVEIMMLVLPTMYFGMPSAAGPGVSISGDGKSILFVEQGTGWTWSYTPTPVR